MIKLDCSTRLVTLLGKPLSQSFSVHMQNAAYETMGCNMVYFNTEIDNNSLGSVVEGLRHMNLAGFGVTKPCKIEVLKYLDGLDPLCEKMGACNTVVRTSDQKLIGYNTDAIGFYTSLIEERDVDIPESKFFCFGAGGAGRAMCSVLAHHGAKKIYITDFYNEAARQLADDINRLFSPVAEAIPHGVFEEIARCDVILNASGVGMGKSIGESPLPVQYILNGQLYYDACYNPEKTQFLLNAEEKGAHILNGLGMLLYQGTAQVELWTGEKAPVEVMRRELLNALGQ